MRFGSQEIDETYFEWVAAPYSPMKKLYRLNVGQHVNEAPTTSRQHELLVSWKNQPVPAGAAVCRELLSSMKWIFFTETWGGKLRLFNADLICQPIREPWEEIIRDLVKANGDRIGGFPDVIGQRSNGVILLCEIKCRTSGDRLQGNQHRFADSAVASFGKNAELMVATWG